jgi:hypothetical protein
MTRVVACCCLVLLGATSVAGDDKPDPPADRKGVTITLYFSAETPFAEVQKVLDGLTPLKANEPLVGLAEKGKGVSADVVATPGTPSKEIAAAVAALLDLKIEKIAVEVKK